LLEGWGVFNSYTFGIGGVKVGVSLVEEGIAPIGSIVGIMGKTFLKGLRE
jgi:hypothetical protein